MLHRLIGAVVSNTVTVLSCPAQLTMSIAVSTIWLLQFAEIAFITYEDDYKLAALLASVTLASCFSSVYRLYQSRLKLYQSVSQSRLIPIVQLGRVR